LAASCECTRKASAQACLTWHMPGGAPAIARYVRVQLEGYGVLRVRQVQVFGNMVIERDGLSLSNPSTPNRLRLGKCEAVASPTRPATALGIPSTSSPWLSPGRLPASNSPGPDIHRTGHTLCKPGRPKNYTLERGVHHLECVALYDGWKHTWPRPGADTNMPTHTSRRASKTADTADTERTQSACVLAVHGDKGTTLLERLCFQASALQQVAAFLIREPAQLVGDMVYTGLVKSMSRDRCIVELDRYAHTW
jgi:hypothetical protein